MAAQTLALAATLLSFAPHGNRVELKLDQGSAELSWLSPSTFRYRRALSGPLPKTSWADKETLDVKISETPAAVEFTSRHIRVSISKRGLLLRVQSRSGDPLMEDLTEPALRDGILRWERAAAADAQFFGLGPRTEQSLNLRGKRVAATIPFLISSTGYGEFHAGPAQFTFDLAASHPGRYSVEARGGRLVDYCFYYGPGPKEIFEEHLVVTGPLTLAPSDKVAHATWETLRDTMVRMIQASMSGTALPTFDIRPYMEGPPELLARARQFAAVAPSLVFGTTANILDLRKRLKSFFTVYELEVRDRGFPVLHPLPFQFPGDPRAGQYADEFMVGDEMLAAPIYTAAGKRTLYLPQGIWTDLHTNQEHKGRQTIAVETAEMPLFARNGTIVPFDALKRGGAMELHYFPRLGAEFFLLEPELAEYTQVHAGPAADIMRLEIESKVDRTYEWVVHHIDKPAAVEQIGAEMPEWSYDNHRNVHVRLRVRAGEDSIVNLRFP